MAVDRLVFAGWHGWIIYQDGWNDDMLLPLIIYPGFIVPLFTVLSVVFGKYFVRVDENGLSFGYSGWNVHLEHSQIINAKKVEIRWIEWGGMGLRMKGFKNIGYILGSGPGIRISTKIKNREYTLNCADPEMILLDLENHGVKVQKQPDLTR
ncbi:MAG: hypothetical protein ACMUIG_05275 [Thermoplasmatota archaeon]